MSTVLIAPIGTTDIQLVYNADCCRCPLEDNDSVKAIPKEMHFVYRSDYKESKLNKRSIAEADAVTAARICTSMEYLVKRHIARLDHLILLATDRGKQINILKSLLQRLGEEEQKEKAMVLLKKALADPSLTSAHKIMSLLINNAAALPLKIERISIIGVGSGSYLESIYGSQYSLPLPSLDHLDINKADFFDYELIEALQPYLAELNSAKVFTNAWGGLSNLHRSLSRVLNALLLHPEVELIHSTSHTGSINQTIPQVNFLELHSNMNRAALAMEWSIVYQAFMAIMKEKPGYFPEASETRMTKLIERIEAEQKKPGNWFSNFFVLILKALYAQDYNGLFIWLKCMEEACFLAILDLPENQKKLSYTLKKNVSLVTYFSNRHGKGNVLLFNDGTAIMGKFSEVWNCFENNGSMKFLEEYGKMFYQVPDETTGNHQYNYNRHLKKIVDRRNGLIHNGRPIQKDPQLIQSLMGFLGISETGLEAAVLALKSMDWHSIFRFERKVLTQSKFFALMRSIAGITESDWLPLERKSLRSYLNIILREDA